MSFGMGGPMGAPKMSTNDQLKELSDKLADGTLDLKKEEDLKNFNRGVDYMNRAVKREWVSEEEVSAVNEISEDKVTDNNRELALNAFERREALLGSATSVARARKLVTKVGSEVKNKTAQLQQSIKILEEKYEKSKANAHVVESRFSRLVLDLRDAESYLDKQRQEITRLKSEMDIHVVEKDEIKRLLEEKEKELNSLAEEKIKADRALREEIEKLSKQKADLEEDIKKSNENVTATQDKLTEAQRQLDSLKKAKGEDDPIVKPRAKMVEILDSKVEQAKITRDRLEAKLEEVSRDIDTYEIAQAAKTSGSVFGSVKVANTSSASDRAPASDLDPATIGSTDPAPKLAEKFTSADLEEYYNSIKSEIESKIASANNNKQLADIRDRLESEAVQYHNGKDWSSKGVDDFWQGVVKKFEKDLKDKEGKINASTSPTVVIDKDIAPDPIRSDLKSLEDLKLQADGNLNKIADNIRKVTGGIKTADTVTQEQFENAIKSIDVRIREFKDKVREEFVRKPKVIAIYLGTKSVDGKSRNRDGKVEELYRLKDEFVKAYNDKKKNEIPKSSPDHEFGVEDKLEFKFKSLQNYADDLQKFNEETTDNKLVRDWQKNKIKLEDLDRSQKQELLKQLKSYRGRLEAWRHKVLDIKFTGDSKDEALFEENRQKILDLQAGVFYNDIKIKIGQVKESLSPVVTTSKSSAKPDTPTSSDGATTPIIDSILVSAPTLPPTPIKSPEELLSEKLDSFRMIQKSIENKKDEYTKEYNRVSNIKKDNPDRESAIDGLRNKFVLVSDDIIDTYNSIDTNFVAGISTQIKFTNSKGKEETKENPLYTEWKRVKDNLDRIKENSLKTLEDRNSRVVNREGVFEKVEKKNKSESVLNDMTKANNDLVALEKEVESIKKDNQNKTSEVYNLKFKLNKIKRDIESLGLDDKDEDKTLLLEFYDKVKVELDQILDINKKAHQERTKTPEENPTKKLFDSVFGGDYDASYLYYKDPTTGRSVPANAEFYKNIAKNDPKGVRYPIIDIINTAAGILNKPKYKDKGWFKSNRDIIQKIKDKRNKSEYLDPKELEIEYEFEIIEKALPEVEKFFTKIANNPAAQELKDKLTLGSNLYSQEAFDLFKNLNVKEVKSKKGGLVWGIKDILEVRKVGGDVMRDFHLAIDPRGENGVKYITTLRNIYGLTSQEIDQLRDRFEELSDKDRFGVLSAMGVEGYVGKIYSDYRATRASSLINDMDRMLNEESSMRYGWSRLKAKWKVDETLRRLWFRSNRMDNIQLEDKQNFESALDKILNKNIQFTVATLVVATAGDLEKQRDVLNDLHLDVNNFRPLDTIEYAYHLGKYKDIKFRLNSIIDRHTKWVDVTKDIEALKEEFERFRVEDAALRKKLDEDKKEQDKRDTEKEAERKKKREDEAQKKLEKQIAKEAQKLEKEQAARAKLEKLELDNRVEVAKNRADNFVKQVNEMIGTLDKILADGLTHPNIEQIKNKKNELYDKISTGAFEEIKTKLDNGFYDTKDKIAVVENYLDNFIKEINNKISEAQRLLENVEIKVADSRPEVLANYENLTKVANKVKEKIRERRPEAKGFMDFVRRMLGGK